jgi:hypothetical protein
MGETASASAAGAGASPRSFQRTSHKSPSTSTGRIQGWGVTTWLTAPSQDATRPATARIHRIAGSMIASSSQAAPNGARSAASPATADEIATAATGTAQRGRRRPSPRARLSRSQPKIVTSAVVAAMEIWNPGPVSA